MHTPASKMQRSMPFFPAAVFANFSASTSQQSRSAPDPDNLTSFRAAPPRTPYKAQDEFSTPDGPEALTEATARKFGALVSGSACRPPRTRQHGGDIP